MTATAHLFDLAVRLDMVLTGRPLTVAQHNARNQIGLFADPSCMVHRREVFYLSDSGYSRIFISRDGSPVLTPNSLPATFAAWETEEAKAAAAAFTLAMIEAAEACPDDGDAACPGSPSPR